MKRVDELITEADAGNALAADQLFASLYDELHRLAEHNLRRAGGPATLGATTLLHEAYLNIANREDVAFPNVELTAPYGHDGAILDLRGFIEHYSESDKKLLAFSADHLEPLLRGTMVNNKHEILAQRDTILNGVVLTDELVSSLMDYMLALTDDRARNLKHVVPLRVPSGLPVDR